MDKTKTLESADAGGLLETDLSLTLTPFGASRRREDEESPFRGPRRREDEEVVLSRSDSTTRPAEPRLDRFPTSGSRTRSPPAVAGSLEKSQDSPAKTPTEARQQVRQQQQQLQQLLARLQQFNPPAFPPGPFPPQPRATAFPRHDVANTPTAGPGIAAPTRPPQFHIPALAPFSAGSPASPRGASDVPPGAPSAHHAAAVDSVAQFLRSLGAPAPSAFPGMLLATAPPFSAAAAPFSAPSLTISAFPAPAASAAGRSPASAGPAPATPPPATPAPSASATPVGASAGVGSVSEQALARLLGAPGGNHAAELERLALVARLWGAAGLVTAPLAQSSEAKNSGVQVVGEGGNCGNKPETSRSAEGILSRPVFPGEIRRGAGGEADMVAARKGGEDFVRGGASGKCADAGGDSAKPDSGGLRSVGGGPNSGEGGRDGMALQLHSEPALQLFQPQLQSQQLLSYSHPLHLPPPSGTEPAAWARALEFLKNHPSVMAGGGGGGGGGAAPDADVSPVLGAGLEISGATRIGGAKTQCEEAAVGRQRTVAQPILKRSRFHEDAGREGWEGERADGGNNLGGREVEGVTKVGQGGEVGVTRAMWGVDTGLKRKLSAILAGASGLAAAGIADGSAGGGGGGAAAASAAAAANAAVGINMAVAGGGAAGAAASSVRLIGPDKRDREGGKEGGGSCENDKGENAGALGETDGAELEAAERMSGGEECEGEGRGEAGGTGGEEGDEAGTEGGGGEEEEGSGSKRKMRLTQEQLSTMEAVFKKTPRLTPREKSALAGRLGVRVRQVEVWFQNRRARTKVKHTEAELDGLRRRCEALADENRRLRERLSQKQEQQRQQQQERPHQLAEQQQPQGQQQQGQTGSPGSREQTREATWVLCTSCRCSQQQNTEAGEEGLRLTALEMVAHLGSQPLGQEDQQLPNQQRQQHQQQCPHQQQQQQRPLSLQLQQAVEQHLGTLAELPRARNKRDDSHADLPSDSTSPGSFLKL
ncbi:hypothetical protein CLOM_g10100 [Closterium sp. NIES-68]|nr:hypothetical protein CLOM_g10100 [Closterium sp. NIES-68]GJP86794.1 hypothetical protein CLOP_g16775 [Closterium sp. NIES-67]